MEHFFYGIPRKIGFGILYTNEVRTLCVISRSEIGYAGKACENSCGKIGIGSSVRNLVVRDDRVVCRDAYRCKRNCIVRYCGAEGEPAGVPAKTSMMQIFDAFPSGSTDTSIRATTLSILGFVASAVVMTLLTVAVLSCHVLYVLPWARFVLVISMMANPAATSTERLAPAPLWVTA